MVYNGEVSNKNTAYLEFSNNPYDEGTGKTENKEVYDWTFNMTVEKFTKVNETKTSLSGAEFVLTEKAITLNTNQAGSDGRLAIPEENTNNLIKFIRSESESNSKKEITYTVVPADYSAEVGETVTTTIEAGEISIHGLDDDTTYYLYEIKAPDGYNLKKDATQFKINADYDTTDTSKKPTVTVIIDDAGTQSDDLKVSIENQSGTQLPSTGGMGTTIFYVLGSILLIGAGVLLVTKKKMSGRR